MTNPSEQYRRWRLVLGQAGGEHQAGQGESGPGQGEGGEAGAEGDAPQPGGLSGRDRDMDRALETVYGDEGDLSDSAPDIARRLGDIRTYFPGPVAHLMQQDALKRLGLRKALAQPELLAEIEPDVALVAQLLALKRVMPGQTKETARQVVRQVVEQLIERLKYPLHQALTGSLNRALRTRRPRRQQEVNWLRTIRANLKHYQVEQRTVVPEKLIGYGRQRSSLRDVILCLDQSGSMAQSVVYASIFGAVMASLPALNMRLVAFDTAVVDLTGELNDPVELLFGIQLKGGTNIDRALAYCQQHISRPRETILVLISDLFEGGDKESMLRRVEAMVAGGVQVIALLALNDQGAPRFNRQLAEALVPLGVPAFACTPDLFPDLMAAALNGHDLRHWAAAHGIVTAPGN